MTYSVLYYKKDNRIGLRQKKLSKRQVWSVGGTACSNSAEELKRIGGEASKKMTAGMAEPLAKKWAEEQLQWA